MLRNLVAKLKPLGKSQIFWCVLGATICLVWMGTLKETEHPDYADASQYIGSAINIAKHGIVNDGLHAPNEPVVPSISREPGYPLLLSVVFQLDDSLDKITRDCLYKGGCGTEPYVLGKWTNRLLIVAAGFVMFLPFVESQEVHLLQFLVGCTFG